MLKVVPLSNQSDYSTLLTNHHQSLTSQLTSFNNNQSQQDTNVITVTIKKKLLIAMFCYNICHVH